MSTSGDTVLVKILFFAKARELSGCKETNIHLPVVLSAADLKDRLVEDYNLQSIKEVVILAVNEEFVELESEVKLREKDEIAIIPPLSGGESVKCFLLLLKKRL